MLDVSIIIVNYHTSQLINNCLHSLVEKTQNVSYEVIVVDNATENLSEVIEYPPTLRIKFIQLPENVGFGRANNEGIKISEGRNLFLLNPDTILLNNAVHILSNYLDNHPDCGACGGNLYDKGYRPTYSYIRSNSLFFSEIDQFFFNLLSKIRFGKSRYFNFNTYPIPVASIIGADLMLRRDIINEIGGFDPEFFMYFEETELEYRIIKAGYKIMSVPLSQIIHLEGKSFSLPEIRERYYLHSRKLYLNKTKSPTISNVTTSSYKIITLTALYISYILGLKTYKKKLNQRLKLIKEIYN